MRRNLVGELLALVAAVGMDHGIPLREYRETAAELGGIAFRPSWPTAPIRQRSPGTRQRQRRKRARRRGHHR